MYHEAGHAAAFLHYGIPLKHVSITPDLAKGYGGHTAPAISPPDSGRAELENWMRACAAGDAASDRRCGRRAPAESVLVAEFEQAQCEVDGMLAGSVPPSDVRNFAWLASRRDMEVAEPDGTGPKAWAATWLEARDLIAEIWPAVEAIAQKLISTLKDMDGQEAAILADHAMKGTASQ